MFAAIVKVQHWFEAACGGAGYTLELLLKAAGQLAFLGRKRREAIDQLALCTLGSLPVVFITALFTGMIVSLQTGQVLRDYGRSPGLLGLWLGLSVLYQALIAYQLVVLGHAIDVQLSFATAAIALTVVTLVTLIPISIGGFAASRALDTSHNDTPTEASRPFDKGHSGFVLSEGAAVVVIERLSHALARGAKPIAIAAGYGTSADAYHLTSGSPDGAGAQVAMNAAIRTAGLKPDDIGYVNAHATSTEVGDNAEINGIRAVFGDRGQTLAVSSTKSATGHMLGAAGAIEAVIAMLALRDQMLPATLNLDDPEDVAAQFDLVPKVPKRKALKHVLSNSFGFGGVNASLVFSAV